MYFVVYSNRDINPCWACVYGTQQNEGEDCMKLILRFKGEKEEEEGRTYIIPIKVCLSFCKDLVRFGVAG